MSGNESEQVLNLLKELSMLKEVDSLNNTESERDAHQIREQRRQEIAEEIKALAEQKKNA
jgi:hypothetical protein